MRYSAIPAWLRSVLILLLLIGVWEAVARLGQASPLLFPTFSLVAEKFVALLLNGTLLAYARTSLEVLLKGMVLGTGLALLLTSLAILFLPGRDLLRTLTAMFNPLPAIALLPLALLWFGLGERSLLFVLVHSTLWPLSLNLYTGFSSTPRTLIYVGQNFGLSGPRMVTDIFIPAAVPYIIAGMKIGWAFAWRTMIAAELVFGIAGGQGGLGWFIYQQRYFMETAAVFSGLVTIVLIGLLMEHIVFRFVEGRTVQRWGVSVA